MQHIYKLHNPKLVYLFLSFFINENPKLLLMILTQTCQFFYFLKKVSCIDHVLFWSFQKCPSDNQKQIQSMDHSRYNHVFFLIHIWSCKWLQPHFELLHYTYNNNKQIFSLLKMGGGICCKHFENKKHQ
jgi:hypothetical protein